MTQSTFQKIRISRAGRVATVTIDNPPVNVLDIDLMGEIRDYLVSVRDDDGTRVIIFQSADPEFFIAHVDMRMAEQPGALETLQKDVPEGLNPFQAFSELLRAQPQVTIVKLAGLARGGGAEFVAAADLVFAAEDGAGLAQCEVLMGITPGGGATQYLGQRMTRGRALEVILGADLFNARLAESYGWINRAFPADQLDAFVDRIAHNIAALEDGVIAAAKAAVGRPDSADGFQRETASWMGLVFQPAAGKLMADGLRAGAQTREGERTLESLLRQSMVR